MKIDVMFSSATFKNLVREIFIFLYSLIFDIGQVWSFWRHKVVFFYLIVSLISKKTGQSKHPINNNTPRVYFGKIYMFCCIKKALCGKKFKNPIVQISMLLWSQHTSSECIILHGLSKEAWYINIFEPKICDQIVDEPLISLFFEK